jgi:hypothetical protein
LEEEREHALEVEKEAHKKTEKIKEGKQGVIPPIAFMIVSTLSFQN